jgi:hypothetical protein
MKTNELRTGDVLVYERTTRGPIFARLIRLCTGSEFTHTGIFIGQGKLGGVLEQLYDREFTFINKYKQEKGERINVWRPRFNIPSIPYQDICGHQGYGIWCLLDDLLQHGLGFFKGYKKRPILAKLSTRLTCSALVAKVLQLDKNCDWLCDYRLLEPQHVPAHPETFEFLGELELPVK